MLAFVPKFYNIFKKICIVFTVFMVVIALLLHFFQKDRRETLVQKDPVQTTREQVYKTINDPQLKKTKEGKNTIALYKTITCSLIGEGCTNNINDGQKYFSRSFFGSVSNFMSVPFINPPASGTWWVQNGLENAGFVPHSYAAEGIGFASLRPLFGIWKVLRDITYVVLVLVMISIGFMIMFRVKLDSQTVISVESALPRIVLSLLLITFSFAIAGFLIDMMYVTMAISISLFAPPMHSPPNPLYPDLTVAQLQDKYLSASPQIILDSLIPNKLPVLPSINTTWFPILGLGQNVISAFTMVFFITQNILSFLPGLIQTLLYIIGGIVTLFVAGRMQDSIKGLADTFSNIGLGAIIEGNIGGILTGLITVPHTIIIFFVVGFLAVPLLIMLTILFTIAFLFFRILFMLFAAYLRILFFIMFGPLFLLFTAIPGQNTFGFWIKNLIGDLLTFPIVTILFLVGKTLVSNFSWFDQLFPFHNDTQQWIPPYLYGIDQNAYAFLLSLGILFIIPDIVHFVREALGIKDSKLQIGFGTFFGGVTVPINKGLGLASQAYAFHGILEVAKPLTKYFKGGGGVHNNDSS